MTVNADTIPSDVSVGFDDDALDGANAFLAQMIGEDKLKKRPSTETEEEATETPQDETGEAPEENTEETPEDTKETDPDDVEVEIKVGEEVKKASLKDLKRLYGQEAALTQKSQKLAEAQRVAEATNTRASTALNAMLAKATDRFKPYADMDWLVLSQRMPTEDFAALRADAATVQADITYLQTELDGVVAKQRDEALTNQKQAAMECIKVLSDPVQGIKDFGKPVYDEMLTFAATHGLPEAAQLTSPAALRIVHMAMQYAKGQSAVATAAQKATKAVQQATRVLKPTTSSTPETSTSARQRDAMRALKSTGSVDDAMGAFMARSRGDA